jgi:hypothetical protein
MSLHSVARDLTTSELIALSIVVPVMYLLRTIGAISRTVDRPGRMACINSFLGWTIVGWIYAMVMALEFRYRT